MIYLQIFFISYFILTVFVAIKDSSRDTDDTVRPSICLSLLVMILYGFGNSVYLNYFNN